MAQLVKSPVQSAPVQRIGVGKPVVASGVTPPSISLPLHHEGESIAASQSAIAPSFIFPPLPFAEDGAE